WNRMLGVALEHLAWKRPDADAASTYNVVQRLTYLAVVFGLFPAFLWTGLGMSFGMTSVFPILATALGGHQSARTLHFVCVVLLVFQGRKISGSSRGRFQELALVGRGVSCPSRFFFARRDPAPACRKSYIVARLRAGLVLYCRMDRCAAGDGVGSCRNAAGGA